MSDAEFKSANLLEQSLLRPAIGGLAPNTPCRWSPFGALHRAQDSVLAAARRVVVDWSISGADDWQQPDGTDDPGDPTPVGAQVYPDRDWRRIGTYRVNVTPGCGLAARVYYCPAGLVQKQSGANWIPDGIWASLRIGHIWTATPGGASSTLAYRSCTMEGADAGDYGGLENTGVAGANWSDRQHKDIVMIQPAQYLKDPDVSSVYSEWSTVELQLEVAGGARVLQVVVYEVPLAHVQAHDDAGLKSAHAGPAGAALTPVPMLKAPDGATFQENRHGTTQTMQVAERQSERLGPRILSASSWDESETDLWQQAEQSPWTKTGAGFTEINGSGATTWSLEGRGWIVAASHAKLHRLCDPGLIMRGGAAAVVPVRVRVDAAQSGSGDGTVRVQSGPYEWVDVAVTGARAIYTMTGYLQTQVYGDEHVANVQVFLAGGGALSTIDVYNFDVDFGAWTL